MASKADIKFYKGVLVKLIHSKMSKDCITVTYDEVDSLLKYRAGLFEVSCKDMTHDQMQELKEYSKALATQIGVEVLDQEERTQNK